MTSRIRSTPSGSASSVQAPSCRRRYVPRATARANRPVSPANSTIDRQVRITTCGSLREQTETLRRRWRRLRAVVVAVVAVLVRHGAAVRAVQDDSEHALGPDRGDGLLHEWIR